MTPFMIGVLGFVAMLIMIMLGIPVFVAMLTVSIAGICYLNGWTFLMTQFRTAPLNTAASYNYAVLPLFILLGTLAGESGVAASALEAMQKWFGKSRGSILMSIVCANAVFGACSGMSVAGSIVFGKMTLPELKAQHYNESFALGTIVAAGTLGVLIPPSTVCVTFCILTDISIGTALLGGIGPAIIMILCFWLLFKIVAKVSPATIPEPPSDYEAVPIAEKLKSLTLLIPIFLLFLLIVGGAFLGWFPATVGAAIGATAVTVYAIAKRVPLKRIAKTFWEVCVMNAGIFPIIVAGTVMSRFVAITRIAETLLEIISRSGFPVFLVFVFVVIFYLICGCIMDIISMVIITAPIVFPLLTGLGMNPFVVCTVTVFLIEIGGMTPPVGLNVFALSKALDVNPMTVFKGLPLFYFLEVAMIFLIFFVPQIVTFIPTVLS